MTKFLRTLVALTALQHVAFAQEGATPPAPAGDAKDPAAPTDPAAAPPTDGKPAGAEEKTAAPATAAEQAALKTEKQEVATPAGAPKDAPAPDHREQGEDDLFGHGMQVGIRGSIVFGYNIDFRYQHSPLCKKYDTKEDVGGVYGSGWDEQQKICGYGAPPAIDVALSFAPFDSIEPFVFGRFGLSGEAETNTKALRMIGLGARVYTMADSRFKIFIEPALAYQFEEGAGNVLWAPGKLNPEYKKDFVFHVGIGPHYDFAKAFGLFGGLGMDVGVLRAISSRLYGQIGAQIRFP